MKKIRALSLLALLIVGFCLCSVSAGAAELTGAVYENGRITVSGTGQTQVQIVLFGPDKAPLYMMSAEVINGKFGVMLPEISGMTDGEYTVKVADYDGENPDSTTVTVTSAAEKKEPTAETGDEIYLIGLLFIGSGIALFIPTVRKLRAR